MGDADERHVRAQGDDQRTAPGQAGEEIVDAELVATDEEEPVGQEVERVASAGPPAQGGPPYSAQPAGTPASRRAVAVLAVAVAALTVVVIVLAVIVFQRQPATRQAGPTATATDTVPVSNSPTTSDSPTPTPPATSAATETPTPLPSDTPAATGPPASLAVKLDSVEPVVGEITAGEQKVDTKIYPNALSWNELDFDSCVGLEPRTVDYDLDRKFSVLTTVVGMSDDSSNDITAHFSVYGDGKLLKSAPAKVGDPATLQIPVSGVLRLQLTARLSDEAGCATPAKAVWADPTLLP
jgi:NPCBM/NEW2 domain